MHHRHHKTYQLNNSDNNSKPSNGQLPNGAILNSSKTCTLSAYEQYLNDNGKEAKSCKESFLRRSLRSCSCNPLAWIFSLFPILSWLPNYNFRRDLSFDLIAGSTVSVMQIPQGMAYALLANVQPVVGIYMAFFPIIIYSMMGTSKHISMGTFAVTCLMVGKTVTELTGKYTESLQNSTNSAHEDGISKYSPEEIATVLSLVTGIFQVLMGVFQSGILCVLLSSDLVSGFTTGAAIHVLTSQVKNLLGLKIKRRNGIFKIPLSYYDLLMHVGESNVTAIIFSVITVSTLVIFNEVIKPRLAKKIPIPVPIELLTIVIATLIARYWITSENYGIPIVGEIPTGIPTPKLPPLELVKDVLVDSFILAIVAYTISISMAKIFAAKHDYEVGANQELVANGASNIVGSFFCCAPISCSLSRSVIQEQVGGRTQMASLFSCLIMVFVMLWIAPFFETLPHCVLSSMIIVALKGMLVQLLDVPKNFKESYLNAMVWTASFSATVILDIEYGLGLGVAFALLNLIWRSNRPHCKLLAVHKDTPEGEVLVYVDSPNAKEIPGIKIVKYTGALNFATSEFFAKKLQQLIPPSSFPKDGNQNGGILIQDKNLKAINMDSLMTSKIPEDGLPSPTFPSIPTNYYCSWLILDVSSVSSIDPAASKMLLSLNKLYLKKDVNLLFVGAAPNLIEEMGALIKSVGIDHFHPSVPSALSYLQRGVVTRRRSSLFRNVSLVETGVQVGESVIIYDEEEDDGDEFPVVNDTVAYFRRLSRSSVK